MQISDKKYNFRKLHSRKQFHILRRLAPAIADIAPLMKLVSKGLPEEKQEEFGIQVIEQLGIALGKLKDEDADFILDGLLDSVDVDMGNGLGFAPIRQNGVQMYQNIDMPTELRLAFGAIKANFADFIPAIRSGLSQQQSKPSTQ